MRVEADSRRPPRTPWLRLYPRAWRDRYGAELLDLVGRRPIDWRVRLDLLAGAIDAHLHPIRPASIGILAPTVAGLAWVVAGVVTVLEPVPPDWPGYLTWTLPLGLVGAAASLRLVAVVGRRSGLRAPSGTGPVLLVALAADIAWIVALAVAIVGGPYGAITSVTQSAAAVGTVAVGILRSRAGDHPLAEAVVIAGGAMLVPSAAAWIVVGLAWLSTMAVGRPRADLRPA